MKGFLVGFAKLGLGFALALVMFSLAGVATARYFMAKLSVLPPKPVFNNDSITAAATATETPPTTDAAPEEITTTTATEPAPEPVERPPGSYEAVVVQPIGLIVRAGPGLEHPQMGGIDYNEEILVLETSEDERWINVRVTASGQEGWVKAGNTQRLGE